MKIKHIDKNSTLTKEQFIINEERAFQDSMNPRAVFNQEIAYQSESVQEVNINTSFDEIDKFNSLYENLLYGKIDDNNNIVVPNPSFIVEISQTQNRHYALNFVKDAYEDFRAAWNKKNKNNNTLDKYKIYDVSPKKSFVNFEERHLKIVNKHIQLFSIFIKQKQLKNKILNFENFIDVFSLYLNTNASKIPFSISNYVSSVYCDRHCSGLCIDIDTANVNDKLYKIEKFYSNRNFNILINLAGSFGFVIDKNVPWKMIANLESEEMKAYAKKYSKSNNIYENFFIKTKILEFNLFKRHMLNFYNQFVNLNPEIFIYENYKCNNKNKIKKNKLKRIPLTEEEILKQLETKDEKWWKLFVYVKLRELKLKINQAQFNNIVKHSYQVYENLDSEAAIEYVEKQIVFYDSATNKNDLFKM